MLIRRKLLAGSAALSIARSSSGRAFWHGVGPLNLNARIVFTGDSISNNGLGGYVSETNILAGGRCYTQNSFDQGVSGNNTTQILSRFPTALAMNPAIIVVEGGINDGFNNGAVTNPNLSSMYTQAIAAGVRVVAVTELRNSVNTDPTTVNNFIRSYPGISVADCSPGFDNPTMTSDGTHPNFLGASFMGNIVGNVLRSLIVPDSILNVTTGQLLSNPTMSGSITPPVVGSNVIGTGVIPTGYRLYENGTAFTTSIVGTQDTSAIGANEQIITIANGSGGTAGVIFDFPGVTINGLAGDVFESWMQVVITQSSGFIALSQGFAGSNLFPSQSTSPTIPLMSGVFRTEPTPLSFGQTTSNWQTSLALAANGSCQVKISSVMARKVPAGQ